MQPAKLAAIMFYIAAIAALVILAGLGAWIWS